MEWFTWGIVVGMIIVLVAAIIYIGLVVVNAIIQLHNTREVQKIIEKIREEIGDVGSDA